MDTLPCRKSGKGTEAPVKGREVHAEYGKVHGLSSGHPLPPPQDESVLALLAKSLYSLSSKQEKGSDATCVPVSTTMPCT